MTSQGTSNRRLSASLLLLTASTFLHHHFSWENRKPFLESRFSMTSSNKHLLMYLMALLGDFVTVHSACSATTQISRSHEDRAFSFRNKGGAYPHILKVD